MLVRESRFKSGNSSDLLRRGEPPVGRREEGDVGSPEGDVTSADADDDAGSADVVGCARGLPTCALRMGNGSCCSCAVRWCGSAAGFCVVVSCGWRLVREMDWCLATGDAVVCGDDGVFPILLFKREWSGGEGE